jgi:multiple sugar transport system permease protein
MYTTFASYLDQLRTGIDANDFDWDIALFPSFKNQPRRFSADASGSVVFRKTRYPEQAWRFSRFISGKFAQSVLAKRNNLQPAIRSLSESSSVWLLPNSKPTNLAVTNVAANEMEYRQTPEYFEDTRIHLDNSVFDILNGTRPVRQTLATVTEQSQLRLDSALRRQPTRPYPWVLAIALGAIGCVFLAIWIVHPRSNHRSHLKDQSRTAIWFLLPTLVGLTCFTLGPMLYALMLSFGQSDMIRPTKWYGIGNYVDAITYDPLFWKSLQVTFVYALLSVPLNVAFSLVLAMFLNLKCYGIPVYRALFYLPSLASGVASSLVWMRIFHPEQGLLNQAIYGFGSEFGIGKFGSWLSQLAGNPVEPVNWLSNENTVLPAFVIMGLWGAGGGTIIFLAGLQAISTTYYEAASIDGASNLRKFYRITIPLLSPSIFFSLITGCIGSFQIFTQSYIMTQGGPNNATMFYLLNVYIQGFRSLKLGYASALAWILFVILLLLTIFQFRYAKKWVHYEGS